MQAPSQRPAGPGAELGYPDLPVLFNHPSGAEPDAAVIVYRAIGFEGKDHRSGPRTPVAVQAHFVQQRWRDRVAVSAVFGHIPF